MMSMFAVMVVVPAFGIMDVFIAVPVVMTVYVLMRVGSRQTDVSAFFLCAVYRYGYLRAGDAAFYNCFFLKGHAGDPQRVQFAYKFIGVGQKFQQGCCQHISGRAHLTVQI